MDTIKLTLPVDSAVAHLIIQVVMDRSFCRFSDMELKFGDNCTISLKGYFLWTFSSASF
jgi:hypothetical protein